MLHSINQNLEKIELEGCKFINNEIVLYICRFFNLRLLNLKRIDFIPNEYLIYIFNSCNKLKKLEITGNYIDDSSIYVLSEYCKELEYLNLNGCINITDNSICPIIRNCKIKSLHLAYCKLITNETIDYLSKFCKNLTELNLSYCNINSIYINNLVINCNYLEKLNLNNTNINNSIIYAIAYNLKYLKNLDINGMKIFNEHLDVLGFGCVNLMSCNIMDSPNITIDGIKYLLNRCNNINSIYITENIFIKKEYYKLINSNKVHIL